MTRRPLALALILALVPAAASAEDLLQTYELARNSDTQLAISEANRDISREGRVQAVDARDAVEGAHRHVDEDGGAGLGLAGVGPLEGLVVGAAGGAVVDRHGDGLLTGRAEVGGRGVAVTCHGRCGDRTQAERCGHCHGCGE